MLDAVVRGAAETTTRLVTDSTSSSLPSLDDTNGISWPYAKERLPLLAVSSVIFHYF